MTTTCARGASPRSGRRPLLALVVLLVLALCGAVVQATPPAGAAGAARTVTANTGPPGPHDDFARLPERCIEDPYALVLPCKVLSYPKRPYLLLWGDSHALMYLPAIEAQARRSRVNLVVLSTGSCPVSRPFPTGAGEMNTRCDEHNAQSLAYVRKTVAKHDRVKLIIGGFWSNYRHNYALVQREKATGKPSGLIPYHVHMAELAVERTGAVFTSLGRIGVPVDVIAQAGIVPEDAPHCPGGDNPYQCAVPRAEALPHEAGNARWLRARTSRLAQQPRVIDPTPTYCDSRACYGSFAGLSTFYDAIHVGARMARTMRPYFAASVHDLLRR